MYIYKITNKINSKCYIGQTKNNPAKRWKKHIAISKNTHCPDFSYIHGALRKYGLENFVFEVIDTATNLDELDNKEKMYIKQLNTMAPNGYNLSSGGQGKKEITDRTRQLLSETKKGCLNPNWNRTFSEKEIEFHRKAMIKRYSDPKERAKTGLKSKEVWKSPGFKEKMHLIKINQFSDEVKKQIGAKSKSIWSNPDFKTKMSAKRKEKWKDPEYRKKWYKARYNIVVE